jgi:hypothetical protein
MKINFDPADFTQLFVGEPTPIFLFTTHGINELLEFSNRESLEFRCITLKNDYLTHVRRFLKSQATPCSILLITTEEYIHFTPKEIEGHRVGAITFFSDYITLESLDLVLRQVKDTDYHRQLIVEDKITTKLEMSPRLFFSCQLARTRAEFNHHGEDNWFSLCGPLQPGQQAVLPTGEISVLTDPSGESTFKTFDFNGTVYFKGVPIVHRGDDSVSIDQAILLFEDLMTMYCQPAIVEVSQGTIFSVRPQYLSRSAFSNALNDLLSANPGYCKIQEIGFGINPSCLSVFGKNYFPNERIPGIHFGVGLGGHTKFHIDFVCFQTIVEG